MKRNQFLTLFTSQIACFGLLATFAISAHADNQVTTQTIDRTILPVSEPVRPPITVMDVRNVALPPRFILKAPDGAPNILIILIDDMGFGVPSTFGGPVHMPTLDALAENGLRYNAFHTTALCSPTRAALLSGRNHHMNNMGVITELATGFQGYTGQRPNNVAPLAEMLRLNGFATGFFGKNHETAAWEVSPSGPTSRWPTRSGFDKFYGFIGGETNQWSPMLYDGLTQIEAPKKPDYHFLTDMTDQAINWMRFEKSLTPDKPFFMYFAPGATHAPHHVPKEWIAKYKGKFDQGWDKLREETLARQIAIGVVPKGTLLAPRPADIKDWSSLSADEKKLFARQMEVYAGYGEYTDSEIGRLLQAIKDIGQLENTLIFYIAGDNGTSAEGTQNGLFNEMSYFNAIPETVADQLKHLDNWGGPSTYPHMASGWAVAGDTPFTWTKQVASDFGGTRNGMVVSWLNRIHAKGELRQQFHHVIDIAPTVLEAASLPEPKSVNGTVQVPIQGVSMMYTFDDQNAKDRHITQYFEMFGNRAIYHDGWYARVIHKLPWSQTPLASISDDKWELYDTKDDFSLTNDLAASNPKQLKKLQDLFIEEAIKNHVLPLDDRFVERFNAKLVGRPDLIGGRTSLTVFEGMKAMSESVFINIRNQSHTITALLDIPKGGANGVILAQGGRFGGWSLYMKNGKPIYTYNFLGLKHFTVSAPKSLPAGKTTVRFEFAYDGGGLGKGGMGSLWVDGKKVAESRIEQTQGMMFSADEGADVGEDDATPVSADYKERDNSFTGKILKITIDLNAATEVSTGLPAVKIE